MRAVREVYHPWYARPGRFALMSVLAGAAAAWLLYRLAAHLPARLARAARRRVRVGADPDRLDGVGGVDGLGRAQGRVPLGAAPAGGGRAAGAWGRGARRGAPGVCAGAGRRRRCCGFPTSRRCSASWSRCSARSRSSRQCGCCRRCCCWQPCSIAPPLVALLVASRLAASALCDPGGAGCPGSVGRLGLSGARVYTATAAATGAAPGGRRRRARARSVAWR